MEMKGKFSMTRTSQQKTPRQVVDHIRSSFLLDLGSASDEVKEGALNLQTQLNNTLHLLSHELYSKKSHFVLELVQNADDNNYAPGTTPHLTFEVSPKCLVVINNETGFREENIRAICSAGASSKSKDKSGYIGEKGIGFKSVFTVSDAPEIHSNGFHIKFDRTVEDNLLGYIVPSWCEPDEGLLADNTTIILPAASAYEFGPETLVDLDARLLLFLNSLRQLTLDCDSESVTYRRDDDGEVSRLTAERRRANEIAAVEEMRYVRVSSKFAMEGPNADHEKRAGIEHSAVVMAFPIDAGGSANPEPASNVFAFLPIRQMGFKFSIQADFILSASREEVLTDRPWNQFLRDRIATVFSSAVEVFKRTEALALSYLKYVPAGGEVVDPFFRSVRSSIVEKLAAAECLRSASGVWKRPNELRLADKSFRSLFPSKHAIELFDFDYLDPKTEGADELLRVLGVRDVGSAEVLAVFERETWLRQQPLEWRAKFYAYVAKNQRSLIAAGLLKHPCLPISDGSYVTPAQSKVFFPLSRQKKYGFESELVFVDGDLYDAAAEHSTQVADLFAAMQVIASEPYELVVSHILPRHKDGAWKTSGHKALIGHLRYVKEKLEDYLKSALIRGKLEDQAYQDLRDGIYVGTKQVDEGAWIFDRIGSLYLCKEYKPQFCIESYLGSAVNVQKFVSPNYLATKHKNPDTEVQSWRQFFTRLGVRLAPVVELDGSNWKCSNELQLLLESPSSVVRKATLECMSSHWVIYAERITYRYQIGRTSYGPRATTFADSLRAMQAPSKKRMTVALSESYYPSPELALLGDALPYVDAELSEAMLDACHVTRRLDAKALVKRLMQLTDGSAASPKHVQAIYRALDERFWHSDAAFIKTSFENNHLIYVWGFGAGWFGIDEVSWRPSGAFMDSLYPPIQPRYSDFSKFFTGKLDIPRELPVEKRVAALERLSELRDPGQRKAEALVTYQRANAALGPMFGKEVQTPDWIKTFESEAVYINQRGEMVENDESLFVDDDPLLAALFEDENDLSFLAIPRVEVQRLSRLFDAAGVSRLSNSVTIEVCSADSGVVDEELTSRIRGSVQFLARVLYSKGMGAFGQAIDEGRFAQLRMWEVIRVPQVKLKVWLGDYERETTRDIARSGNRILYRTGAKSVGDMLAEELSHFLVSSADLADTFARILMSRTEDGIEDFLEVRHIGALPLDLLRALDSAPALAAEEGQVAGEREGEGEVPSDLAGVRREVPSGEGQPAADGEIEPSVRSGDTVPKSPSSGPVSSAHHSTTTPTDSGASPKAPPAAAAGTLPPRIVGPTSRPLSESTALGRESDEVAPASAGTGAHGSDKGSGAEGRPVTGMSSGATYTPTKASSKGQPKRGDSIRPRTKAGRLLSYVAGPGEADKPNPDDDPVKTAARKATERAAVEYFMATQAGRWQLLTEMPPNNPGFDILAVADDGQDEFVEIKGQSGAWTEEGVALTPTELMTASQKGSRYWLCVVEYALDERRRQLHLVRNLYGLIQQFRFDVGWNAAAETAVTAPQKPEKGMYIDMLKDGSGKILSVRSKGRFFNLHVILDSGQQVNKLFNPAKMTLSKEPAWQE
jgi:hypothetical protein